MTVTLGTRLRFFSTTSLLVIAVGCMATPQPNGNGSDPPPIPMDRHDPTGAPPVDVPTELKPAPLTRRIIAQGIYVQGLDLWDHREWDLASLEFSRALDVDPTYYRAWFKKGLCAYEKQRYDTEIYCYIRCLEIKPDYVDALLNLGNAYLAQDILEMAVPRYISLLKIDSKHPIALYNLGICYFDLGDYHDAIDCLVTFIDNYPNDPCRTKAEALVMRARQKDTQR